MNGRIFSIEEFSTFDGPGIRTTVFLKGCPLRCVWCHNPEGQDHANSFLRSPNGCIRCGACLDCGEKLTGKRQLVKESIYACPRNLIRECAIDYTPSDLCTKLLKNAGILNSCGGGVTFSGGEPLFQHEFLSDCLDILEGKMNRAIQTSGKCGTDIYSDILKKTDYILFDLKLISREDHIKYTGQPNDDILNNFMSTLHSGKAFTVRIPLIPSVTDTEENLTAIAALLKANKIFSAELLPYNKMAGSKYAMSGKYYDPPFDEAKPVNTGIDIFTNCGITATLL